MIESLRQGNLGFFIGMKLTLGFGLLLVSMVSSKILIENFEVQVDPKYGVVKHTIKDKTHLSMDATAAMDADDVVIEAAVYSKIDENFSPFIRPDPIHVCKLHEHEDPLIKFIHDEINKFGNITKACPVKKGEFFYIHDFVINEADFPMPMPVGEFRVDVNASVIVDGKLHHVCSNEVFFKIVK